MKEKPEKIQPSEQQGENPFKDTRESSPHMLDNGRSSGQKLETFGGNSGVPETSWNFKGAKEPGVNDAVQGAQFDKPRESPIVPPSPAAMESSFTRAREWVTGYSDWSEALRNEAALSSRERPHLLKMAHWARRDRAVRRALTAAGRGLLGAIDSILDDQNLWRLLSATDTTTSEVSPMSSGREIELGELLAHHIPTLLVTLDYAPPPPAEDWTELVQNSLRDALADPSPDKEHSAALAEYELRLFAYRLRILVETAEQAYRSEEQAGRAEAQPLLRRRLAVALRACRNIPVLTALIPAIVKLILTRRPGTLKPEALELILFIEKAVLARIAKLQSEVDLPASPQGTILNHLKEARQYLTWLSEAQDQPDRARCRFIVRRNVSGLLQAAGSLNARFEEDLSRPAGTLFSMLEEDPLSVDTSNEIELFLGEIERWCTEQQHQPDQRT